MKKQKARVLSPLIFNLYNEEALHEIKEILKWVTNLQGEVIPMICFADDVAIISEIERKLQGILIGMEEVMDQWRTKIP